MIELDYTKWCCCGSLWRVSYPVVLCGKVPRRLWLRFEILDPISQFALTTPSERSDPQRRWKGHRQQWGAGVREGPLRLILVMGNCRQSNCTIASTSGLSETTLTSATQTTSYQRHFKRCYCEASTIQLITNHRCTIRGGLKIAATTELSVNRIKACK